MVVGIEVPSVVVMVMKLKASAVVLKRNPIEGIAVVIAEMREGITSITEEVNIKQGTEALLVMPGDVDHGSLIMVIIGFELMTENAGSTNVKSGHKVMKRILYTVVEKDLSQRQNLTCSKERRKNTYFELLMS